MKKLYRRKEGKVFAGVCGGLGEYFSIDPVLIRAIFVIATILGGAGVITYIVLWIVMPEETEESTLSGTTANDPLSTDPSSYKNKRAVIAGIVLMTLGIIFLIKELFPRFDFEYVFPLLLIAVGVFIIWNSSGKNIFNQGIKNQNNSEANS